MNFKIEGFLLDYLKGQLGLTNNPYASITKKTKNQKKESSHFITLTLVNLKISLQACDTEVGQEAVLQFP